VTGRVPPLGLIEGFYGRPYDWADRAAMVRALAPAGFGLYLYAPKADEIFRRHWRDPIPTDHLAALKAFADICRGEGVRFGVGLSPYELYLAFDGAAKRDLAAKLSQLDEIGVQDLGIFFDDMRGDVPDLAARQIEIGHWIAARTAASKIALCPSYYTDDPVLDRVFGARPADYLTDLGAGLDPKIDLMWTGPEVCSRELSPGHLTRVTALLGRKPLIWDNYPVNDGPRMSPHLHLRAFTGRPTAIGAHIAGHVINLASQPVLSRIPALSLAASYAERDDYDYGAAFARAATAVLGRDLCQAVTRRLMFLEDVGREGLTPQRLQGLRAEFAAFDHPAAREIVAWLDGFWTFTPEAAPT
jgi:hypothetical protein